jgi:hypothetical protein
MSFLTSDIGNGVGNREFCPGCDAQWQIDANPDNPNPQPSTVDLGAVDGDDFTQVDRPAAVNLTPHAITLRDQDGNDHIVPPSGTIARVEVATRVINRPAPFGLPVQASITGDVTGLPDYHDGTILIVSGMVLSALAGSGRNDVMAPATGPADGAIRNDAGHIVAVTRLNAVPL